MGAKNRPPKNNREHYIADVLKTIIEAGKKEITSNSGRINFFSDILLVILLIVYVLTVSFSQVARIIASIWNDALTRDTGDNIVTLLLIFVGFSLFCLFFMHFTNKETFKVMEQKKKTK